MIARGNKARKAKIDIIEDKKVASTIKEYEKSIKSGEKTPEDLRDLAEQVSPEKRDEVIKAAIQAGEDLLKFEVKMSKEFNERKLTSGRPSSKKEKTPEQQEKLTIQEMANLYKLGNRKKKSKQTGYKIAQQILRLADNEDLVEEEIREAWENHDQPPTRASVMVRITKRNNQRTTTTHTPQGEYTDDVDIETMEKLTPIRATSLFANVGISEFYLEYARVKVVLANELLPERADWHKHTYPDCEMIETAAKNPKTGKLERTGDIYLKEIQDEIVRKHIDKKCCMIIATPPCQSFSKAGKRDLNNPNDPRTPLFIPMLDIIKRLGDNNKYVLIENVPEYAKAAPDFLGLGKDKNGKKRSIVEYIIHKLEKDLGYKVSDKFINAADYGTPQSRERCIILACKKELGEWKFPEKSKYSIPLWKAIGHLPANPIKNELVKLEEPIFFPATNSKLCGLSDEQAEDLIGMDSSNLTDDQIKFLIHTPTGKSAHDNPDEYLPVNKDGSPSEAKHKASFSREDWNKPASTITSDSGYIGGHNTIHPGRLMTDGTYSDPRVYTLAEILILTGFNSNFWYQGMKVDNEFPKYRIPGWALVSKTGLYSEALARVVLGESFLPKLAMRLCETIPNRPNISPDKPKIFPKFPRITGEFSTGPLFTLPPITGKE